MPYSVASRIDRASLSRNPSAAIPLGMSAAHSSWCSFIVVKERRRNGADEGTAAKLFQLLFAGQAPFVTFFASKWLPRMPSEPCT